MNVLYRVHSLRNSIDFALRQVFSFGFAVTEALPADVQFQKEMTEFFAKFDWEKHLAVYNSGASLKVLDVGARNFSLAPVFHRLFRKHGFQPEVRGIEIDANRRLRNFRTRRDYAAFFVAQTPDAQFHACDFLKWETPADCIFALNPFVTKSPLLAWGLPLKLFRPEDFFQKLAALLAPSKGLLFVTNPTPEEVEITQGLLSGRFELLEKHSWLSSKGGHPRYAGLYRRI